MREAAKALKDEGLYERAMNFYEALRPVIADTDVQYHIELGQCYRHQELYDDAELCFRTAADIDGTNQEALEELVRMFKSVAAADKAGIAQNQIWSRRKKQLARQEAAYQQTGTARDPDVPLESIEEIADGTEDFDGRMLAAPIYSSAGNARRNKDPATRTNRFDMLTYDLRSSFAALEVDDATFYASDRVSQLEWFENARAAIEHFKSYKFFWPYEKQWGFTGYKGRDRLALSTVVDTTGEPSEGKG